MVIDLLIALLITAVAVALGLAVHPLLFLIVVFALVYLVSRHGGRRRVL